jgi:hypothetical protein
LAKISAPRRALRRYGCYYPNQEQENATEHNTGRLFLKIENGNEQLLTA